MVSPSLLLFKNARTFDCQTHAAADRLVTVDADALEAELDAAVRLASARRPTYRRFG